jgi:hypothetical protein
VLPRELQLRVFQTLIDLHIEDHEKDLAIGRFKGNRARTKRWVGEEAGRRELIKLSRVSGMAEHSTYILDLTDAAISPLWETGIQTLESALLRRSDVGTNGLASVPRPHLTFCSDPYFILGGDIFKRPRPTRLGSPT